MQQASLNYVAKSSLKDGAKPKNLIICSHGYGADASNLVPIWRDFDGVFEDAVFIFPNAPEVFEFGPPGFQWYSLLDRSREVLLNHSYRVQKTLTDFISQMLTKYELSHANLSLFGFSQGAMVSLFTGIRLQQQIKCIIGFSGTLIAPDLAGTEAACKPPVCLIHGDEDVVVPIALSKVANTYLKEAGFNTNFCKIAGLEHSIDSAAIDAAKSFIAKL